MLLFLLTTTEPLFFFTLEFFLSVVFGGTETSLFGFDFGSKALALFSPRCSRGFHVSFCFETGFFSGGTAGAFFFPALIFRFLLTACSVVGFGSTGFQLSFLLLVVAGFPTFSPFGFIGFSSCAAFCATSFSLRIDVYGVSRLDVSMV